MSIIRSFFAKLLLILPLAWQGSLIANENSQSWGPVTADDPNIVVEAGNYGRVRIKIARPNSSSVSINRYIEFSSTAAGLEFDNVEAAARTIVNEVTGTNPTRLQGVIEVLGTRANVIIANRNGIYVNGANFVNFGGLALTTGELSSRTYQTMPGKIQEDIVVTTNQGRIVIEEGGLSGTFSFLELLAKNIEVRGPLVNNSTAPSSYIRLTAGESVAEFDSDYVAGDANRGWASIRENGGTNANSEGQMLVTITRGGSISASNIHVVVNDRGAGVNMVGDALARAGDFTLTAGGEVVVAGGNINAANQVKIASPKSDGASMKFRGMKAEGRRFAITGDRGVSIDGASIKLEQGRVTASGGSLEIVAGAGGIENYGSILEGSNKGGYGVRLSSKGKIVNKSLSFEDLAIISANDGDFLVNTESDLENYSGRFLAAGNMELSVGGYIRNHTLVTGGKWKKQSRRFRWYTPWNRGSYRHSADFGELVVPDGLAYFTAGKNLSINAAAIYNRGGEFNANGGNLKINAGFIHNEALRTGRFDLQDHRHWWVLSNASAKSSMSIHGGTFSAAESLDINAENGMVFKGGRLFALQDVNLSGLYLKGNALPTYHLYQGPQGLRELWDGKRQAILTSAVGAEVAAGKGGIHLDFNRDIELHGGHFSAPEGVHGSGWEKVPPLESTKPFENEHFGLFGDLFD